jgi:ribonuclease P protein component
MEQTFCREERLRKKSLIAKLFEEGNKWYSFPFRVSSLRCRFPSPYPVQLLISVPRSLFKKASDRNRVKRLIREAYRKNKQILYEPLTMNNDQMLLSITYTSKEIVPYQVIQQKIIVLLQRLKEDDTKVTR